MAKDEIYAKNIDCYCKAWNNNLQLNKTLNSRQRPRIRLFHLNWDESTNIIFFISRGGSPKKENPTKEHIRESYQKKKNNNNNNNNS